MVRRFMLRLNIEFSHWDNPRQEDLVCLVSLGQPMIRLVSLGQPMVRQIWVKVGLLKQLMVTQQPCRVGAVEGNPGSGNS